MCNQLSGDAVGPDASDPKAISTKIQYQYHIARLDFGIIKPGRDVICSRHPFSSSSQLWLLTNHILTRVVLLLSSIQLPRTSVFASSREGSNGRRDLVNRKKCVIRTNKRRKYVLESLERGVTISALVFHIKPESNRSAL